ncbi:unnamed protein product [Symbiodinium sp. CCMP2592]|nr:unnamed protein product [Symbiodinium sp. CCMP2592]
MVGPQAHEAAVWPLLEQDSKSGLKTQLEQGWLEANVLHEDAEAPDLTAPLLHGFQEQECRRLGLCLCKPGPDSDAYFMHKKIVMLYKNFFVVKRQKRETGQAPQDQATKSKPKAKKTSSRLLLESGFLVLSLRRSAPTPQEHQQPAEALVETSLASIGWSETAMAQAVPSGMSHGPSQRASVEANAFAEGPFFFHIGFVNYTTYDFTVLPLTPGDTHEEAGRKLRDLHVPQTPRFMRAPNAFRACIDFDARWTAGFHVIFADDSPQTVWDTVANKVEVEEQSILPEVEVWKAGKRRVKGSADDGAGPEATEPEAAAVTDGGGEQPDVEPEREPWHAEDAGEDNADNVENDRHSNTDSDHSEALEMALEQLAQELPADAAPPDSKQAAPAHRGTSIEEREQALLSRLEARAAETPAADSVPQDDEAAVATSRAGRKKTGTEIIVPVGHYGELHYYPLNNSCTAICRCKRHGNDCKKGRTFNELKRPARSSGSRDRESVREAQGRPIGLLVHWLMCQDSHPNRQAHCDTALPLHFSLDERKKAREFFSTMPKADEILRRERAKKPGEAEEPDFIY